MTAGTEVAVRSTQGPMAAIPAKLQYAHELAESGLLPRHYQQRPANILWAMEYGEMLGLTPMAAITGVHVIEGKPTASAGLISALVRRAGHKLRISGDTKSATCQIVRADDPTYTFEVTFTIDDAKAANLTGKDVWKKYASSMLKARAITQCARDACEEALFGLHYTPEEMGAEVDEDGVVVAEVVREPERQSAADAFENAQAAPSETWYDDAIARAVGFESETAGGELFREAAARARAGECTPGQATHIQNLINARVADRRKEASERFLALLPDDDDWKATVRDIADVEEARARLAEVDELAAAGTMDETRADNIGAAIRALFPMAGVKNMQTAAA